MNCLLVLVLGIAAGGLVVSYLSRRQVKLYKTALEEVMYITHHKGINPRAKRIRGLTMLGQLGVSSASSLATREADELKEIFKKIESEALELENEVLETVKEFEHLQ